MSKLEYVNGIESAPKAIGPYSQAVKSGNLVFLSGQIPIDPQTGKLVTGGIEEQSNQVMKNLKSVLNHLNLDFKNVMKTTILLSDLGNFQVVNGIYEKWLDGVRPAMATFQVAGLPMGALVEIEMIATTE